MEKEVCEDCGVRGGACDKLTDMYARTTGNIFYLL
jgi:hypothetical protein